MSKFKELESGTVTGGYKYTLLIDSKRILVFPPMGNGISISLEALEEIVKEVKAYRSTQRDF